MSALEGVVVLDLTSRFWSSMATALLGDFGADIIKVEGADSQERQRGDDGEPHESGTWNWRFDLTNRNKRSLGLDLATPRGADIFRELVARADVAIGAGVVVSARVARGRIRGTAVRECAWIVGLLCDCHEPQTQ